MIKKRNETVDIIRGIAMIMVILGHSMGGVMLKKPYYTISFGVYRCPCLF